MSENGETVEAVGPKPGDAKPERRRIRMGRGQMVRILFGAAFLVTAIAVMTPHLFNTISTDAVINARVIPLFTPIRGTVRAELPKSGSVILSGGLVASIRDRHVDRIELDRMGTELAGIDERISAQRQVLIDLERLEQTLEINRRKYQRAALELTGHRLSEARAALATAKSEYDRAANQFQRRSQLRAKGIVSQTAIEISIAAAEQARQGVLRRRAEVAGLVTGLKAIGQGVFADAGRNDVPYSQQRMDEIALRKVDVRAVIREMQIRAEQLRAASATELRRYLGRSLAEIRAPIKGIVWRNFVHGGAIVAPNDRIAALIDCSNLVVNVALDESHFEDVHTGDKVKVLLIGSTETLIARVVALRGMGASRQDDLLAARLPPLENNQFLVTLSINGADLAESTNNFCHVGRNAEVRFRHKRGLLSSLRHFLPRTLRDETPAHFAGTPNTTAETEPSNLSEPGADGNPVGPTGPASLSRQ